LNLERLRELYQLYSIAGFGHSCQRSGVERDGLGRTEFLGTEVDDGTSLAAGYILRGPDHRSSDAIAYLIRSDKEIDDHTLVDTDRPDLVAEQTMNECAIALD
jgi:hypothetical protein